MAPGPRGVELYRKIPDGGLLCELTSTSCSTLLNAPCIDLCTQRRLGTESVFQGTVPGGHVHQLRTPPTVLPAPAEAVKKGRRGESSSSVFARARAVQTPGDLVRLPSNAGSREAGTLAAASVTMTSPYLVWCFIIFGVFSHILSDLLAA